MELLQIKQLFEQNKLKEAYGAIRTYLKQNPNDKDGQKLHDKIYKAIQQFNQARIDQQIKKMTELINNQQYQQAIDIGLQLKPYNPSNQQLLKLISQAYQGQKQQQKTKQKGEWAQLQEQVQQLQQQHRYNEILQLLEQMYARKHDPRLQQLNLKIRQELVDYKLDKNRKNMDLLPPKKVMSFLENLQKIYPKHEKLKELIREYQAKLNEEKSISRKHYIKEAKRQIKVLYFQEKYEKSIQACLELIKAAPKNHAAKKFYLKNQKAIERNNHKVAYKKMKQYHQKLKQLSPEQQKLQYLKI